MTVYKELSYLKIPKEVMDKLASEEKLNIDADFMLGEFKMKCVS